jgi:hypothetical protein
MNEAPNDLPFELRAKIEAMKIATEELSERVITAVLVAASDCNIDPDFAFSLAEYRLAQESDKVRVCEFCTKKRKRCRGCSRRTACYCRTIEGLCSECDGIVQRLHRLGAVINLMNRRVFGE